MHSSLNERLSFCFTGQMEREEEMGKAVNKWVWVKQRFQTEYMCMAEQERTELFEEEK